MIYFLTSNGVHATPELLYLVHQIYKQHVELGGAGF